MNAAATKTVEVWEQEHNGANWETIPGAAWDMQMHDGESFRAACIRHGGEFPNDRPFRLVAFGEDGGIVEAEEFEPGEI